MQPQENNSYQQPEQRNTLFFGKKYRDDIAEVIVEGERKMVSHAFYDKSFGWECSWKCSVIGIILEEKKDEKRE